jgi:hypothetical protein
MDTIIGFGLEVLLLDALLKDFFRTESSVFTISGLRWSFFWVTISLVFWLLNVVDPHVFAVWRGPPVQGWVK